MIKIISAVILCLLLISCGPPQDGHGTHEYNNGTYVGEYKDGKRHGQGTFTSTKGTQYVGAWKYGKMHGEGTYTFASGNQYRGEWKNGSQWTGKEYDKDGNILSAITNGKEMLAVIEENVTNRLASKGSGGTDFDKGLAAYKSGDYATALGEFRPLAEQGHADAQTMLGNQYFVGRGVPQDDKTAVKWYTLAAEQGNANAQYRLGEIYELGHWGVRQSFNTALKWYNLGAEQGNPCAQYNLSRLYGYGRGVPANRETREKWYTLAFEQSKSLAEQGNADAQMLLAELYYNGYGVLEDLGHFENYVYAYMWGDIAASNGNFLIFFVKKGNSGYWRDKAASYIIPDEIAKAKKLVSECVAKKYKGC